MQRERVPSESVHLRVNYQTLRICLGVVRQLGIPLNGLSLAQVVRIALDSMAITCEELVKAESRYDADETYALAIALKKRPQAEKLGTTVALKNAAVERVLADMTPVAAFGSTRRDVKREMLRAKIEEATFKMQEDPDNMTEDQWYLLVDTETIELVAVPFEHRVAVKARIDSRPNTG